MKTFKHIKPSRIAQMILVALAILAVAILSGCKEDHQDPQYISIDGTVHSSQIVKNEYDKQLLVVFKGKMDVAVAKDSITQFERDTLVIRYAHSIALFNLNQSIHGTSDK